VIRRLAAVLLLALCSAAPAFAQAIPVDDSGSQVLSSTLKMQWDDALPRGGANATLSGTLTVHVRLDVAPLRGRRGRIYQVLPTQAASPIRATWTTGGMLLPGSLEDGGRALVYAGPIDTDLIEDTLRLTIQAKASRLSRQEQLHFAFEFEPDLP
jgi:hypothetical protein